MTFVAGAAFICAGITGGLLPNLLPNSSWRVPQDWARFGQGWYASIFGVALGLGFITAIPAAGFYAFVLAASTLPSWEQAGAAFFAFGLTRAAPIFLVASGAWLGASASHLTQRMRRAAAVALPFEVALLLVLGFTYLR